MCEYDNCIIMDVYLFNHGHVSTITIQFSRILAHALTIYAYTITNIII